MASRINGLGSGHGNNNDSMAGSSRSAQVAHTLTACCRCRRRKTRCDAGLPKCGPCERNGAYCEYFDATKGKKVPRSYVIRLEEHIRDLEKELASLSEVRGEELDPEVLVRGAGLVKIQENEEPSYLGPSSGINMTRLVLELAKGIRKIKKIKELVPEEQAQRIRATFEKEWSKPTSKDYPEISSVAAPSMPSKELTDVLVENFFKKGQYLFPVLHEPSFRQSVVNVYSGSPDPYENFALRMVIALSMQKLSSQWTGLADSYYLAALQYLESTVRLRNLGTIQCFMLIAQYSIVTPTRTAANWIVLLAVKLCQELGIAEESTIGFDSAGNSLDALEIDMRRRCFWVCFAMEHGLAHSMGRPNSFGTPFARMNIGWFRDIDDQFITRQGILPAPASPKKQIAIHFISMRLLQLEIRRTLYLKRRPTPLDDSDPWFHQMEQKLDNWLAAVPSNSDGTYYDTDWFTVRLNTIVVFLFRPSPQIPEPSVQAARKAFMAAKANIETQRRQIEEKKVELTWIFCQTLFMAINTILWAISYADIRREFSREQVSALLGKVLETTYFCSLKWPGVEGAIELYGTLSHTCLKAYDGEEEKSYSLGSPINRPSPATTGTPEPLSPPVSIDFSSQAMSVSGPSSPDEKSLGSSHSANPSTPMRSNQVFDINHLSPESALTGRSTHSQGNNNFDFDPGIFTNPLPPALDSGLGGLAPENLYSPLFHPYTLMTYDPYSRALAADWTSSQPVMALDLQQQTELMSQLETGRMDGILG